MDSQLREIEYAGVHICAIFHHDGTPAAMFKKASSNITTRMLYDSEGSIGLALARKFLGKKMVPGTFTSF
jgi:hypothetical protein